MDQNDPDFSARHTPAASALPTSNAAAGLDPTAEDWMDLFAAVEQTLRTTIADWLALTALPPLHSPAWAVRARLLDCVSALGQLRHMPSTGIARHRHDESGTAGDRAALDDGRVGETRGPHLASHDELTTLPNHRLLRTRLEHGLADRTTPRTAMAVFVLDLDGFKAINDAHGHRGGDEILRIVGARLTGAVRAGDLVGRIGGDEFACLIADLPGREPLRQIAGKLLDTVAAPLKLATSVFSVHPSIGIARWPEDGVTADELLHGAAAAMRHAKRQRCGFAFVGDRAALPGTTVA